jgi:hypothetical protein
MKTSNSGSPSLLSRKPWCSKDANISEGDRYRRKVMAYVLRIDSFCNEHCKLQHQDFIVIQGTLRGSGGGE